jgi:membrane protease YdiL (CAAX protease family)
VLGIRLGEPSLICRMALAVFALYIAASAAVSVAFLAQGVGVVGIGGGQGSSSFSTQLLMMPLMATVLTLDAWAASVACIAVSAVTWEARRAASRSVRWLDDPGDDLERETTVWRALIAATAFFTAQAMSLVLLELFAVPTGYQLAIAFGMSAALLALLTFRNAARFERPRFLPRSIWAWPLGAAGGAASGWLALRMAELLPKPTVTPDEPFSSGEAVAIFATLVVMAPLAEEYFFRGWLQKAIENDLPEARKRWAFALGAVAFALAHIGTYGVPQLVLGLLAGGLYARFGGLWPAILAHAIHNGLVLLAYRP